MNESYRRSPTLNPVTVIAISLLLNGTCAVRADVCYYKDAKGVMHFRHAAPRERSRSGLGQCTEVPTPAPKKPANASPNRAVDESCWSDESWAHPTYAEGPLGHRVTIYSEGCGYRDITNEVARVEHTK